MALYHFHFSDEDARDATELTDDVAAWSELVSIVGAVLMEVDGRMPDQGCISASAYEGERCVGSVRVYACKGGPLLSNRSRS